MELYVPRLLPSLPSHLFFLIVTACCASLFPYSICLDPQYQYCQNTTICGNMNISYPFGVGNRGCGLPTFQIDCVQNSSLVIAIQGQNYTILWFYPFVIRDRNYNSFEIVGGEKCKFLDEPINMQILPLSNTRTTFRTVQQNRTLNVYKCSTQGQFNYSGLPSIWKCNATVYYGLYDNRIPTPTGCSKEQVTVNTGTMTWYSNDTKNDESCRSCEASRGICGYNTSDSASPFLCYCKDGPRSYKCPGHGRVNESAIILIGYGLSASLSFEVFNININGCTELQMSKTPRYNYMLCGFFPLFRIFGYGHVTSPLKKSSIIRKGCSVGGVALTGVIISMFYVMKRKPSPPCSSTSKVVKFLKEYAYEMPTRYSQSDLKKITNNFAEKLGVIISMFYVMKRKPSPPCSSTSKVEKFLKEYAYEMPTRYSQSDLKKITNNFAEKLGEGGFGVVYKGMLRNSSLVAVKLLDRHRHSETQFMSEVATVGRVHHFNVVRLVGYCFESIISALIYEYMANGSLEKFIFAGKEKHQVLRWEQLYSIALGAARGIAYLHQDCDKRIIHFDIKPHNILLDAGFTPKVSDFGLAKLCGKGDDHISMTAVRGTPGYVAPELCDRELGPVTDKSDVYSFGMLLLEIVGGRKNIDVQVSRSSQLYFPEWAFKMLENEELEMRTRRGREGEIEADDEANARRLMTKVGLWCIQHNYRDRPCMARVVRMLEGNGNDLGKPPFPFDSSSSAPQIPLLSSTENTFSIEIKS